MRLSKILVSYVWNNYIKKHDDQEFIVITKPKMEDGKYPKYFLDGLYILRLDISEIKYEPQLMPSCCRIIT